MGRGWLALVAAALLVAPEAPPGQEEAGRSPIPDAAAEGIRLHALLFHGSPTPRLLTSELRISGIDPRDVQRTVEAYNRRSEVAQLSRDSLVVAPYLLQQALEMDPDQLLQLRLSARTARLVFQFTWR